MSDRIFMGVNGSIIHPQWGVPMSFHRVARAEHDLIANKSYIVFASYYNQASAENGLEAMSHNTITLDSAMLTDERSLLEAVIDSPDNALTGSSVVESTEDEL